MTRPTESRGPEREGEGMRPIFTGNKSTLDDALDTLCTAKRDWIKNDRVTARLKAAIGEIQRARAIATNDLNKKAGVLARLD